MVVTRSKSALVPYLTRYITRSRNAHIQKRVVAKRTVPKRVQTSLKPTKQQLISKIRRKLTLMDNNNVDYLLKRNVLEWVFAEESFLRTLNKTKEDDWGKSIIGYNTNQWTTKLGETLLKEILYALGKSPSRILEPQEGTNNKRLLPDFDAIDGLYENKARTYSTTGTAGEKILGTPLKYCECRRLYRKHLYIVCMAYQEHEAEHTFHLFEPKSDELKKLLTFYDREFGITYVKATDLLKQIL
jgi:hypothetical protein